MNRIVYSIPRYAAKEGKVPHEGSFISVTDNQELLNNSVWISIGEPDDQRSIVSGPLDKVPNLKLCFWDLKSAIEHGGKILYPPNESDARRIVNFLLKHKDNKSVVIINCAAGVSRSGAVAQFCQDFLNYEWNEFCKSCSVPNSVLYRLMVNYYQYLLENENIMNNQLLDENE